MRKNNSNKIQVKNTKKINIKMFSMLAGADGNVNICLEL